MAIDIIICDDNREDAKKIGQMLDEYSAANGFDVQKSFCNSADELISMCERKDFDIFILDVMLGEHNGIDIAREIRKKFVHAPIIFMSCSRDYAVESYEIGAEYYMLKPVNRERFIAAMEKCRELFLTSRRFLDVVTGREMLRIYEKDIISAEAFGNRVVLHTTKGDIPTYTPLDKILQGVGTAFLRCHRSFCVNMSYIERVNGREFLLKNGDRVPIRTNGRADVLQLYNRFLVESVRR